jgi:exopolysaccharide biosynthesis polyprenyl glycosylphosphotransferase
MADLLAIAITRIAVKIGFVGFIEIEDPRFYFPLVTFAGIYLIVATMFGLYRGSFHLSLRLQNFIMFRAFLVSVLIANSIILFSGLFYYRLSLAFFFIVLPLVLLITRYIVMRVNLYFQKLGYGIHETLIIGYNGEFGKLFSRFSVFPELGYNVRGYVSNNGVIPDFEVPRFSFDNVEEITEQFKIDRIFITADLFRSSDMKQIEKIARNKNIKVKIISPETENVLKIARIYDIAGVTLFYPTRSRINFIKNTIKRIFDIIGASIITLILSPIFIFTALAIYIETGRPIFFLQKRSALRNQKGFEFIKFRSMVTNAEQLKAELMEHNESDGALFKMKNDPRVTTVGKIIRKLSVDELPQLINVIKGDMSLVGPRPLPPSDFDKANEPEDFWNVIKERGSVKPGMTGLWQVSGRSNIKFREMILLDLYYVENHSILFDLEILFETIPVVLFGKGAY